MKIFDEIQEGKWQEFCQDWIERRDNKNMIEMLIIVFILGEMDIMMSIIK